MYSTHLIAAAADALLQLFGGPGGVHSDFPLLVEVLLVPLDLLLDAAELELLEEVDVGLGRQRSFHVGSPRLAAILRTGHALQLLEGGVVKALLLVPDLGKMKYFY